MKKIVILLDEFMAACICFIITTYIIDYFNIFYNDIIILSVTIAPIAAIVLII